jgi:nitrite reductase/ring-hydroxylating ferredoxin subunit
MSLKHVEVDGIEIALINLEGQYFAIGDRCGHMNSPLSRGQLRKNSEGKNIVVCPLHGSTFDVTSGKNLSRPVKASPADLSCLAQAVRDQMIRAGELSAAIRVHDVLAFEVERQDDEIKVNLVTANR